MKRLTALVTLITIGLAATGTAPADDNTSAKKGVDGSWEGRVIVTPEISLRITLDIAKGKDGSLSGKWGSPDQGAKDLTLESP